MEKHSDCIVSNVLRQFTLQRPILRGNPVKLNLDIQNILVLRKMYELRNVKLVAETLGKTPGAISKNISKLKTQLNDPLFVQTKQGFEPTAFLEENLSSFDAILASVESIGKREFSAAALRDTVIIYANTLFWDQYGDQLYLDLREQAPHAKFSFRRWGQNPKNRLIDGENAIAVHNIDESLPQSIYQRTLGTDRAVFFVREDHPAKDISSLMAYPMVVLKTPGWNDHKYRMLDRLRIFGFQVNPAIEVEHPVISHKIVQQSDHYGLTMSYNVPDGCRVIEPPNSESFNVTYVVSCRRAQQRDPQNQWLFDAIIKTMKKAKV